MARVIATQGEYRFATGMNQTYLQKLSEKSLLCREEQERIDQETQ